MRLGFTALAGGLGARLPFGSRGARDLQRKSRASRKRCIPIRNPKFSIVSAVYNVEKYLHDYFHSIVMQPEFLDEIEVIVVDDGSTDSSLEILNRWQERFPTNIFVKTKLNGGQASARNLGMKHATGEWITFIDPDDFIAADYFQNAASFIHGHDPRRGPLHFVSCNFIIYREDDCKTYDSHPLKYRYKSSSSIEVREIGNFLQLSVNNVFFLRANIAAEDILFDERIKPNFEDAYFVARVLLAASSGAIGFASDARYYYRKRVDGSSSLDGANASPARYDDVFEYGHRPLCALAEQAGDVPRWLQRTLLYDIIWLVKALINQQHKLHFLSPQKVQIFKAHLADIFRRISPEVIESFELAGILEMHKIGLLGTFKGIAPQGRRVIVRPDGQGSGTFIATWYSCNPGSFAALKINGHAAQPLERKRQRHTFLDEPFVYEHHQRLPISAGSLTAEIDGVEARVQQLGRSASRSLNIESLATTSPDNLTAPARNLVAKSKLGASIQKYKNCWVLMDRDTQADDNAEHLYRYLRAHRPDIKAYFVLRRSSHDWDRLEAEGFSLIAFGSNEHDIALLNAAYLISSHVDRYVVDYLPKRVYGSALDFRFVFLQHGVIMHDLSHWLNGKDISLMLATTYDEYHSIAGDDNHYKLLPSNVALTGLPRHDQLFKAVSAPRKMLAIMPTWRESLLPKSNGLTNERLVNPDFMQSAYARAWRSLLHSERLEFLLAQYGYEAAFFPHANIQPYLTQFCVPSHIEIKSHVDGSIQRILTSAKVMLTDYSSVAFDAAYLTRPIVYYQFDRDELFSGGHLTRKGYFDYERDGFGPVSFDEASVLDAIEAIFRNDGEPEPQYLMRMLTTFKWRDGKCCERVTRSIEQIGMPAYAGSSFTWGDANVRSNLNGTLSGPYRSNPRGSSREEGELASASGVRESGF